MNCFIIDAFVGPKQNKSIDRSMKRRQFNDKVSLLTVQYHFCSVSFFVKLGQRGTDFILALACFALLCVGHSVSPTHGYSFSLSCRKWVKSFWKFYAFLGS